jgi:hypothetical protein
MLREDSRDYQKAVKNANHKQKGRQLDMFDPDRVLLDAPLGKWEMSGERRAPVIGYGRKNVNAMNKKR